MMKRPNHLRLVTAEERPTPLTEEEAARQAYVDSLHEVINNARKWLLTLEPAPRRTG